jgi:tripartite-type tricarboxylate transporter receptor subunit TctC
METAPPSTTIPRAVVDRMNMEIKKAIDSPDTKKRLEEFEPWTLTQQQMVERVKVDHEKYGKLMKLVGTKPQ